MTSKSKILESINSIHRAIVATGISKNGSAVIKTQNSEYKFSYQKLDDIYNVISRLIASESIVCIPSVINEVETIEQSGQGRMIRSKITVEYTFTHLDDGSSIVVRSIGEDSDKGSKSTVKAMSAAHKTALKQLFMIPTEGDESNVNNHHSTYQKKSNNDSTYQKQSNNIIEHQIEAGKPDKNIITQGQSVWLSEQIKELGLELSSVLNHYKIQNLSEFPKNSYEELRNNLVNRKNSLKVN